MEVAGGRRGVFTVVDARDAGVSRAVLRTWVRRGIVRRLHQGVYGLTSRSSFEQQAIAACLASSGRASHWTAARLWGFDGGPSDPIHVAAVRSRRAHARDGFVVHTRYELGPLVLSADVPVTSPPRTLIDVAGLPATTNDQLVALLGHLLATRVTTYDKLETTAAALETRMPGVARARRLIEQVGGGIESVAEAQLASFLADWQLPPSQAQYEVLEPNGRFVARVDRAWPEKQVILEMDGHRFHSGPTDFETDRRRQNRLVTLGLRVVPTTPTQLRDHPEQLHAELVALLGATPAGSLRRLPSPRRRSRDGAARAGDVRRRLVAPDRPAITWVAGEEFQVRTW